MMGCGSYSVNSVTGEYDSNIRYSKTVSRGTDYTTMSLNETFKSKSINNAMNPYGIKIRESRDSDEHPESLAVILGLDVTGSMGSIPHHLVKKGLPEIMGNIIQSGTKHPQILFLAIGDHECDISPLQVSQFESSDELLDKWLTDTYLEGGGGGNYGESYLLAWYFVAYHTSIDCFEKRKQKGFLFTIGDEPVLKNVPKSFMKNLMGDGQYEDFSAPQLLEKAREKYNVYHLHISEGSNGNRREVIDGWKQLMGDNLIIVENHQDVSKIIPEIIKNNLGIKKEIKKIDNKKDENKREEMML